MDLDQKDDNVAPVNDVNDASQDQKEETVSYANYSRVVGKNKKLQSQLTDMEKRMNALETERLEATGQKDDVIARYKEEIAGLRNELKSTKSNYGFNAISSSIKEEARVQGCTNPNKLLKLLDKEDLEMLSVDENWNVDRESIQGLIQKAKKEHADISLFKDVRVNHTSVNQPSYKPAQPKTIQQMSKDELKDMLRNAEW